MSTRFNVAPEKDLNTTVNVRKSRNRVRVLAELLASPGAFCFKRPVPRKVYKAVASALLFPKLLFRHRLVNMLPPITGDWKIDRARGFVTIPAERASALPALSGLLRKCDEILYATTPSTGPKSYLQNRLSFDNETHPEFLAFALEPTLIRAVAEYLGSLPVIGSIKILHSPANEYPAAGSQLYHCDHDDVSQVKLFLHLNDVDAETGPLHILPADLSTRIKERLNYSYGGVDGHVPDAEIRNEEVRKKEVMITGRCGTLSLVDTSRCFHFGSRITSKDRFIFYVQYLTPANFLHHPLATYLPRKLARKLAHPRYFEVAPAGLSDLQKAVLQG